MEFNKVYENGTVTYKLKGRLDIQSSPDFEDVLKDGFEKDEYSLIFDCENLEYMSSAGLRTLLYAKKKIDDHAAEISQADENVKQVQAKLKLKNVQGDVLDVLEMTGFTDLFGVGEDDTN